MNSVAAVAAQKIKKRPFQLQEIMRSNSDLI